MTRSSEGKPEPGFAGHTREYWDARYADSRFVYGTEPNAYLFAQRGRFAPGQTALVPGDGEGRNSVWLAGQGLAVTAVDLSPAGVAKGKRLAAARGVAVTFLCQDLSDWAWPVAAFDVVAAIYLHLPPDLRPRVHRAMVKALKPGGLIVLEAYTPDQVRFQRSHNSGGPPRPDMMFTAELLRADFAGCEALELAEVETELSEGIYHAGPAAVVRGVFRRAAGAPDSHPTEENP
jgi:SAM-dependent methyltransferase